MLSCGQCSCSQEACAHVVPVLLSHASHVRPGGNGWHTQHSLCTLSHHTASPGVIHGQVGMCLNARWDAPLFCIWRMVDDPLCKLTVQIVGYVGGWLTGDTRVDTES